MGDAGVDKLIQGVHETGDVRLYSTAALGRVGSAATQPLFVAREKILEGPKSPDTPAQLLWVTTALAVTPDTVARDFVDSPAVTEKPDDATLRTVNRAMRELIEIRTTQWLQS